MERCSVCGYDIIPGDSFCTNCGARYDPASAQVRPGAGAGTPTAAAFDSQPAATDLYEPAAEAPTVPPVPTAPQAQAADAGQTQSMPGNAYARQESFGAPPGQFSAGPFTPPGGAAASQAPPVPQTTVDAYRAPVARAGAAQTATVCLNCGQAWTGSQACTFCGQVWGLPKGIVLSSAGRRFGGHLLEGLLFFCTLMIGWIIWTLVVWTQGQTPAKQVLGMRVVRLDTRTHARWGRMFLRDFVGKLLVGIVSSLIPFVGAIAADCWLLWDKDKQELWDKLAGTIVVNDPDKLLAPPAQPA